MLVAPFLTYPLQSFSFESVTLDHQGEITDRRMGQADCFMEALDDGAAFEMVFLSGGIFQMGSPHGQGYVDEIPRHMVSLASFLIGRYPVTQEQWRIVMGKQPKGRFSGANLPVENISWREAEQFCRKLSKRTGHDYHLPAEAQWEYACRAGTSGPFSTGETITTNYANYCGDHTYRDEPRGVYRHGTTPVEQFPANPFGICDLHGNLWEFCSDRWHADYTGAPFDGTTWEWGGEAGYRIARGGSWHEPPGNCRSATRLRVSEKERDDFYGFRLALSLPAQGRTEPPA